MRPGRSLVGLVGYGEGPGVTPAEERRKRRREERLRVAMTSGWDEIPRSALRFRGRLRVVDTRDGTAYLASAGEAWLGMPNVDAYFVDQAGEIVPLSRRRK